MIEFYVLGVVKDSFPNRIDNELL